MSTDRERVYDPRGPSEQKRHVDYANDDPSVIKIRGLPYQTTAIEVCRFFKDCEIVGGPKGIYFPHNERGLPTGEAFVEMESATDIDKALERHKDCIGERFDLLFHSRGGLSHIYWIFFCRYIEVFESRMSVMERVKKTRNDRGIREREIARERGLRAERGFGGERGFGRSPSANMSPDVPLPSTVTPSGLKLEAAS